MFSVRQRLCLVAQLTSFFVATDGKLVQARIVYKNPEPPQGEIINEMITLYGTQWDTLLTSPNPIRELKLRIEAEFFHNVWIPSELYDRLEGGDPWTNGKLSGVGDDSS